MSIERVRKYLEQYHKENEILEFDVSSATVELAAQALQTKPEYIAKTMSFLVNEQPILIVTAGNMKIDNAKYKHYFHKKAKMIPYQDVETIIGHKAGGVCPFGINEGIEVYLDVSLKQYEYVYPACGSSHSAIRLTILELEQLSNYKEWIDVCKC